MVLMVLPDINEDETLLRRLQSRDESAVVVIYERYFSALYHYVRLKVGDRAAAQDIVSDVFLQLIRSAGKPSAPRENLRGWLFSVARNLAYRTYGDNHQLSLAEIEDYMPASSEHDPDDLFNENFPLERVRYALRMLAADHQEVLILRFGQRLSLKETADLMGKSASAIKSLQFRAVETLRSILIEPEANRG